MTEELNCRVDELKEIEIIRVNKDDLDEWNIWIKIMDKYHYLGSPKKIGAEIRYLIASEKGILGAMGFSFAAWHCKDRDEWVGWDKDTRIKHLQGIVNNSRFLILPQVKVKNLASKVLSMSSERIKRDWEEKYGKEVIMLETFVDKRFTGASYKAANWINVGQTKGRGKWDINHSNSLSIKHIYVYPLVNDLQKALGIKKRKEKEKDWVLKEFKNFHPGDKRLQNRLCTITRDFFDKPEANIPQACKTRAKTKAAYRFFKNKDVKMEDMLDSHKTETMERLKKESIILAVQDTTSLNYTGHEDPELGFIGDSPNNKGIIMHDTMTFNTEGVPLGLADLQLWVRDPKELGKRHNRAETPIEAKESYKWLKSYKSLIPIQEQLKNTTIVSVGDREADIFELFQLTKEIENAPKLLIRARHNRKLKEEQQKLWETMMELPVSGKMIVEVPRKPGQKKRIATLDIRFSKVKLLKGKEYIEVWSIYANEPAPPENIESLSWLLLTTLETISFEEAIEKIKWYIIRWQIEMYHKIIKSGCRIESRQLNGLKSLRACIGVDLVVAWRVFYLTKLSRQEPNISCTVNFQDYEWKALYTFVNKSKNLPAKPPTLRELVHMIASLGGFLGRKGDGEPGSMTLWRGLTCLSDIVKSYLIFNPLHSLTTPALIMGKG